MDTGQFQDTLNLHIRAALDIADASPDVRDEEPWLVAIVELVQENPDCRLQAEEILEGLVPLLGDDRCPVGLVELLGYCVHALDLPGLVAAAEEERRAALRAVDQGGPGRLWDHARRCERVVAAADPNWEERDVFEGLAPDADR